jgi:hypothetical protein
MIAQWHPNWDALNVLICAVPSAQKSLISKCMAEQCLPALAEWMRRLADRSLLWAQIEHRFVARYQFDTVAEQCDIQISQT